MKKLSTFAVKAGLTIERIVYGHCYARNGNAHNPTEKLRWDVRAHGKIVGSSYKYSDALELAEDYAKDPR